MINKVIRNTYAIAGGIIFLAFGVSFISTKVKPLPTYVTNKEFSGEINSISDIEDLEYSRGCKFYFYDQALINTNLEIKGARDFKINKDGQSKLLEKVKADVKNCTKGRFFYYKIQQ